MTVRAHETTKVQFLLVLQVGRINIKTVPANAAVKLDGINGCLDVADLSPTAALTGARSNLAYRAVVA